MEESKSKPPVSDDPIILNDTQVPPIDRDWFTVIRHGNLEFDENQKKGIVKKPGFSTTSIDYGPRESVDIGENDNWHMDLFDSSGRKLLRAQGIANNSAVMFHQ